MAGSIGLANCGIHIVRSRAEFGPTYGFVLPCFLWKPCPRGRGCSRKSTRACERGGVSLNWWIDRRYKPRPSCLIPGGSRALPKPDRQYRRPGDTIAANFSRVFAVKKLDKGQGTRQQNPP